MLMSSKLQTPKTDKKVFFEISKSPYDEVWRDAVETTLDSRDEGVHVVKKRLEFIGIDAEALKREVIGAAGHVYNAYGRE